jgi:hypothetical protein
MLSIKDHAGPSATALAPDGTARSLARRIGRARLQPIAALQVIGAEHAARVTTAGRVCSAGRFRDPSVHDALAGLLGPRLANRLRPEFEWYVCRSAFFHNDAHYGDVLFGVWCVAGDVQLVFPRADVRLGATTGEVVVFDPFEIHGVLARGATVFEPERQAANEASVFVGFELSLEADVREAFGITEAGGGVVIASATRISPRDGTIV